MPEAKKVRISKEVQGNFNISEDAINKKLQKIVDMRTDVPIDELFDEVKLSEDLLELFSKEELVALFLSASNEAGLLTTQILQLVSEFNLPHDKVTEILSKDNTPSDEEIGEMYTNKSKDNFI